jgi:hypothetical protein
MPERPKIEETYKKGSDTIRFVVYARTDGTGDDEVLQHKMLGAIETAHITLHPNGTVNLRVERGKESLIEAVRSDLAGYSPNASTRVKQFITKVKAKLSGA